jgi:uncharacterized protein YdeI (YjbR/CyaY-like superfamily)
MPNTIFFESFTDFYQWFAVHHAETPEVWVGFYKKKPSQKVKGDSKEQVHSPSQNNPDGAAVGSSSGGGSKIGITYAEAVDAALCFGWIDGIRKSIDEASYANRFTPRKVASSIWSDVNLKRIAELIELGLVQSSGLAAYNGRNQAKAKQYSHEQAASEVKLAEAELATFQAKAEAWAFFQAQPASYQKVAIWWVISAKQDKTRFKRLETLIEDSQQGQRLAIFSRKRVSRSDEQ